MARQLYVRLASPTIELTVEGVDGGGKKAFIVAGFKRYPIKEAAFKLQELDKLREEINAQVEAEVSDTELDTSRLDAFLKDNVVYLLDETLLTLDGSGKEGKLKIKDTRLASPEEDFWETPEECKDFILDMYLDSLAWRLGFSNKLSDALINTKFEEAQLKN